MAWTKRLKSSSKYALPASKHTDNYLPFSCATSATVSTPSILSSPSSITPFSPSGTVTIRIGGDWTTLDPANPTTTPGIQGGQILGGLYDTLLDTTSSGKLIPYLASSWKEMRTSANIPAMTGDPQPSDGPSMTP